MSPKKALLLIGCLYSALLDVVPAAAISQLLDRRSEFTDERYLSVVVLAEAPVGIGEAGFFFSCFDNRLIRASVHVPRSNVVYDELHRNTTVSVRMRFDRKPGLHQDWAWDATMWIAETLPAGTLFDEALVSDQLIVRVYVGNILRFDLADARTDLMEFKQRCGAAIQRP